jgi:hypothetical protein
MTQALYAHLNNKTILKKESIWVGGWGEVVALLLLTLTNKGRVGE